MQIRKLIHKIRLFIAPVIFIIILSGCASLPVFQNRAIPDSYKKNRFIVHYIDVGQGDSILIQVNSKNMLIDAGPGESNLVKYLKEQQIKTLDYVVETHPHEDHIGNMVDVINDFNVSAFYAPKVTTSSKAFENMVTALKKHNLRINVVKPGIRLNLGNNITCEFLAPVKNSYTDLNNYSAVIKITYGNTSFLFMGDAQKLSEQQILNKGYNVRCDVLKVGHHGSSSSTSKDFLNNASPEIAIISCGKNNVYGHPHSETLQELKSKNITIYRTDKDGTIIISSDGKAIERYMNKK